MSKAMKDGSRAVETNASAGELDESQLDAVSGGAKSLTVKQVIGKIWAAITPDSNNDDTSGGNAVIGTRA